ncbi:hypothetical protein FQR65_LT06589 [Abscondita terminalis]|nr:hypothetical protein FQR65_LT06589 [Abscondita terminalis]
MFALVSSILILINLINSINCNLHVKVKPGELIGKYWISRSGKYFEGFTGIPYAKPPIHELRFKEPVELESWNGILNATELHPVCPQLSSYSNDEVVVVGNEDCLFLNIYAPVTSFCNSSNQLLPVLFYIHGGSYTYNSARPDWLGPEILLDKNIILVTLNYRLGALGFLSTGDHTVPGNNGLKDQHMALKWVKNNIIQFCGNPNKITIAGNSAGASSVQFHMMSPLSKDLINSVIIQSGSALSSYALSSKAEAIQNTLKLGKFLNCSSIDIAKLVECLQCADVYDILTQQPKFMTWGMDSTILPFRPVIETETPNAFIFEHPKNALDSQHVADVPMVIGIVAQEGAYQSAGITTNSQFIKDINKNFDMIVSREFSININNSDFVNLLKKKYFNNQEITNMSKSQLTNMYTDGWTLRALYSTITTHFFARKTPIYLYLYEYSGSMSFASLYDNSGYDYGVCHTDELFQLLSRNKTFPNYNPNELDRKISNVMTELWANFVHLQNPTPISNLNFTMWNPVSSLNLEYYHIKNHSDMQMKTKLYFDRINFWRSISRNVLF